MKTETEKKIDLRKSCFLDPTDELDKELLDTFFSGGSDGRKNRGFYHESFGNVRLGDSDLLKFCLRHAKKTLIDTKSEQRHANAVEARKGAESAPAEKQANEAKPAKRSIGNIS